ncbi:MAG: twin-arginine translocation signal domain-containing protein [Acidobacteria bacterium]|nr:twin-arginine translocation signal domain-containing protein [Acidobacteriota bacterium]
MVKKSSPSGTDRRDFLKQLAAAGLVLCVLPGEALPRPENAPAAPAPAPAAGAIRYQYRTVSVKHLPELEAWFTKLKQEKRISDHPIFRKWIDGFVFKAPEKMPGARSLVVTSLPQKIGSVTLNREGKRYTVIVAPGYVDDGITFPVFQETLCRDVLKKPGSPLIFARLPLKTLAVRCGLAEYGRNNVTYVKGYGSFHQLLAFYTEVELPDQWRPLKQMAVCKRCGLCSDTCPTKAIRKPEFVIDAGKCISLYNEIPDPMPDWIDPKAHNALAGCMKCQYQCLGNRGLTGDVDNVGELTEAETGLLLEERRDAAMEAVIIEKLKRLPIVKNIPYVSRNLKLAFANCTPM